MSGCGLEILFFVGGGGGGLRPEERNEGGEMKEL